MSAEPQLFRVDPSTKESRKVSEAGFAELGLQERRDIQEWVVANPGILGDDLLIIAKEFSDFDRTNDRLDLLAVDTDGKLVIIELKRDNSGVDAHWQAIKYASYLRHAIHADIVRMFATHENLSESDAKERLIDHTSSDALENLNSDQRIILASHRFAPEVTSAALWLNDQAQSENLITCIQLIPYQDGNTLYLQSNTIIPVPGTEPYTIQIGNGESDDPSSGFRPRRSSGERFDKVTRFVQTVESMTLERLPDDLKTDRSSRFARRNGQTRWYSMWYSDRDPWSRDKFTYVVRVITRSNHSLRVVVNFQISKRYLRSSLGYPQDKIDELARFLEDLPDYDLEDTTLFLRPGHVVVEDATKLDDALVEQTSVSLGRMIEATTTKVEGFVQSQIQDLSV